MQSNSHTQRATQFYQRHRVLLGTLIAFAIPLKLSIAYVLLIPTLTLWIISRWPITQLRFSSIERSYLLLLCSIAISALFGIDLLRSLNAIHSLLFFFLVIPLFAELIAAPQGLRIPAWLLIGQSVAAFHSVLQAAFPQTIRGIFLGSVTESGQLSLSFILALGLIFALGSSSQLPRLISDFPLKQPSAKVYLLGIVHLSMLLFIGFWRSFSVSPIFLGFIIAISIAICLFQVAPLMYTASTEKKWWEFFQRCLITTITPLLALALLVNLKRGPWFGVLIGVIVFFLFFKRRFIFLVAIISLLLVAFIGPIQDRLAKSSEHFFIQGGRNVIWQIGVDLAQRYPLGIGYDNSPFLQKFSSEIPSQLKHFHNNVINILVENGWISLMLFFWWLCAIFYASWKKYSFSKRELLPAAIGCAVLSWQMAGVVEYNFGDSEVMLVMYVLLATLIAVIPSNNKVKLDQ